MSHVNESLELFGEKYHCSQRVFTSFSEEYGVSKKDVLKIGGCFGSGIHKGEVCGACTGILMVLGLRYAKSRIDNMETKIKSDMGCDKFLDEFEKEKCSYLCKTLLGCDISTPERLQYTTDNKLFTSFNPKIVKSAVLILKKILEEY